MCDGKREKLALVDERQWMVVTGARYGGELQLREEQCRRGLNMQEVFVVCACRGSLAVGCGMWPWPVRT